MDWAGEAFPATQKHSGAWSETISQEATSNVLALDVKCPNPSAWHRAVTQPMLPTPHHMARHRQCPAAHKPRRMLLAPWSIPRHCCHLGGLLLLNSEFMDVSWFGSHPSYFHTSFVLRDTLLTCCFSIATLTSCSLVSPCFCWLTLAFNIYAKCG